MPHAEPIRSSNVWRIVPTSSSTPNTIPTPRTTPKRGEQAARSGRVRSWRTARPSTERSIGRPPQAVAAPARRGGLPRLERGEEVDDALRRAAGDLAGDAAVAQEDHAIGDRGGGRVVRDHQDRAALGAVELAQDAQDLAAAARVEVAGRLVGEHQLGLQQQRAGDRDALLLAARQLAGRVRRAVAEPDEVEQRRARGRAIAASARRAISAGSSTFSSAVSDGQQVEELEDEADVVAAQARQRLVVEPVVARAGRRRRCRRSATRARRRCAAACSCRSRTGP